MISNNQSSEARLFTIGYEADDIDAFIKRLNKHRIECVIDVRKNPISRKKGFSKTALRECLEQNSITYIGLRALGIEREKRNFSSRWSLEDLFRWYLKRVIPANEDALRLVLETSLNKKSALMCFERDFHFCHRFVIAQVLESEYNCEVIHI